LNKKTPKERLALLADIAEQYFVEGKTQEEIAQKVGVTRSSISRMLTEARSAGIVLIKIRHPIRENNILSRQLIDRFHLIGARVIKVDRNEKRLQLLGQAAGDELIKKLKSGFIIGTSWGTAVSTTVDEIEETPSFHRIKVVQLLGAMGARLDQYDAHAIVQRLANKLNAEGIYMNAPFLVDDQRMAESLLANKSIQETLSFGKQADIALFGVGSSELEHSSYYLAGHVNKKEILEIQQAGAIGDVCGRFYDINGNMTAMEFQNRLIGISVKEIKDIPIRIGVASGKAKVVPIIGALKGGLINILISDESTIRDVLKQTN
jgi:DNA-binding transcriptional regulator LsrR (DeoR family)